MEKGILHSGQQIGLSRTNQSPRVRAFFSFLFFLSLRDETLPERTHLAASGLGQRGFDKDEFDEWS